MPCQLNWCGFLSNDSEEESTHLLPTPAAAGFLCKLGGRNQLLMAWLIHTVHSELTMLFLRSPIATIPFIFQITSLLKLQATTRATGTGYLKWLSESQLWLGGLLGQDGGLSVPAAVAPPWLLKLMIEYVFQNILSFLAMSSALACSMPR